MYASQLLRILETFPKNVNDDFYDFAAVEPVEAMKESPRRYTNPFLSDEENEKINLWNNQEIERLNMGGDLTTNCDEDKLKNFVAPSDLCEKETELYTDKNVTECELPELLVCYKDGAFHVKDICVDDGIPKEESILFDETNNEILKPEQLRFTPLEDFYMESNLCSGTIGKIDTDIAVFEPTSNHMDNGQNRDEVIERKSDASSGSQEVDLDKDCKDAATEQVISNSMPSLQQDQNQPLPSLKSLLESIDNQHSYQSIEELSSKRYVVQTTISNESTTEENNTLNLHNHKAATSSGVHEVENPEHVHEPSIEPQGVPKDHDIGSDNVAMMNPVCRGSEGESSFSVAGPVSGLITYSGPIAFSGSISLRSDSSTTSTRSFAFPILQNEWNSSPVRMAKADRRRLQKHRGWRHGLLCCVPHLKEGDVAPQGGKPGWAAIPSPRMTSWLILLKKLAQSHNLLPEFEITLEATHHGPVTNKPTMFVEIGSTIDCWKRQDAAQVIAQLVWEGLGIGGGEAIGNWNSLSGNKKVLLGLGGGHYVPRHMDIILKGGVWVGHLLSGYSLPMEDPSESKDEKKSKDVGGTWKHAIKASYDATVEGFPGGEVIAHLDHKSFKGWQKKAIIEYLDEQNIKIGKPGDFY